MSNKSFTLIELLVVIVIIGILAGVIIVSVSSSINKANFAKAQSFSNTVQNELLGDLVSEWTFNSPAVANITEDSWGNNDGTVSGATYKTKADGVCVYGGCYSFDGSDDYIEIADSQEMRMTQGGTIIAWIYPEGLGEGGYGRIIDKSNGTDGQNGYVIYSNISDNNIRVKINADTGVNASSDTINLNQWQLITVIFNSLGRKIYINGADVTSSGGTLTSLPPDIGESVRIGNRSEETDRTFDGLIDDVRIYNRALSSSQIKQQYVAGLDSLLAKEIISKEEYNLQIESLASK